MNKQMMKSMMVACMAVFAFASASQAEAASVNISLGCNGVQVRVADNCCSAAKHRADARRHREEMARREAARRHREEMARREAARRHYHCAFRR